MHMPGMNRVIFSENDSLDSVVDGSDAYKTMLTEWFVANEVNEEARRLTYLDFPSEWVWNGTTKVWTRRKRGAKLDSKIGRIYHVHPGTGELHYLRMLLMVVTGPRCFDDLKRHDGVLYATFKESCQARGLVGDDNEWVKLFDEAVTWASPFQLRHLFKAT